VTTLATYFGCLLWLLLWLLQPLSVYRAFFCQLLVRQASVRVCATCVYICSCISMKWNCKIV
jgi:hypothetical protein